MNRRQFLHASAAVAASAVALAKSPAVSSTLPATLPSIAAGDTPLNKLPLWRGFNLLELFDASHPRDFQDADFALIASWGFNFVRIPASYLCWSSHEDWMEMREKPLTSLDRAIALGKAHGVHVNINLHRLPGYCVNPPQEPADLWTDSGALDAAVHQWAGLANRFKDIPSSALSFDLINEPDDVHTDFYVKVITRLVQAIRAQSPDRLIIADGLRWGRSPVPELASLDIGQSTRGYAPNQVSHYKASWLKGSDSWAAPTWPLAIGGEIWDRARLQTEQLPWRKLQQQGVGVHVGEWGAFNKTPHEVVMLWMKDSLELWKSNNWGWSLWNLHGSFGVLNSGRADVKYERFKGHLLDREMLELLQAF
jgi:endoglucanase